MLTRMTGTLNRVLDEEARIQVGDLEYQVLIPEFVRRQIQLSVGSAVTLHLIEYIEGNLQGGRLTPRLIGFLAEAELDFFELFCTVDKIGVKKALKAMGRPIREIADAIQRQDVKWLTTMPGVGKTSAEQIIATLRTKVAPYALAPMPTASSGTATSGIDPKVLEESYSAMLALGINPTDARDRMDRLIASGAAPKTVEEAINLLFKK